MPTYQYSARDRSGKSITATMEATSQSEVARNLREKGYFITKVSKEDKTGLKADIKMPAFMDQPSFRDITLFSRQFATVINAGLPIVQSLAILQQQAEKAGMRNALKKIREDLETGQTLSISLAKFPRIFNDLYVYLVKAGEASGNLDGILERIASYQEKQAALRGKLKSALTYPMVVLVIALGVTYFLLATIVPQFAGILEGLGGDLPFITKVLMAISDFLRYQWWLLLLIIVGSVVSIGLFYRRTSQGRHIIDRLLLTLPVVGPLQQKAAIASFSNTFGLLLKSGVNVIESIDITKGTAGNIIVEDVLSEAKQAVQRGEPLSETLKEAPKVFPPLVSSMVAIGEETGALDTMLEKIASFYEREVDEAIESLTAALEPMMIVFLGGIVGFIVAGMFLPMFAIIGTLSG
ncbi:MAG: type II secretion system F family protein [Deinococcales bacterium]